MSVQQQEGRPPAPQPTLVDPLPTWPAAAFAWLLGLARAGTAGATPVDRTAARIQRALVMAVLAPGWALARSHPRFDQVLPAVALLLLAAGVHPALSLPRLISGRLLPALHLRGPSLSGEDPAPRRAGDVASGLLLGVASLLAHLGIEPAAWALGWTVIVVALVEFTFDNSLVALLA